MLKVTLYIIFLSSQAFAIVPGEPWCFERDISLNKLQLKCLRSLDQVRDLQIGIGAVLHRRSTCPKCPKIVGEDEVAPFFQSPFLVLASKFNRLRGVEVDIVFKDGPNVAFEIQMEPRDDEGSERSYRGSEPTLLMALDPDRKISHLLKELRRKEFEDLWLRASIPR